MPNIFRTQVEFFEPLIEPIKDAVELLQPIPLAIRMSDLIKEMGGDARGIYSAIYTLMLIVDISVYVVDEVKSNGKLSDSLSLFLEKIKPIDQTFEGVLVFIKTEPLIDEEKEQLLKTIQEMKEGD